MTWPPLKLFFPLLVLAALPQEVIGGPVAPVPRLPPARSCQDALRDSWDALDRLPGQVNGAAIAGPEGLRRLRAKRGDALIIVRNGQFPGADFRRLGLHNICFVDTDLSGSDWRGAIAPGLGFVSSELKGAKLQGARMPGILIQNPYLENVDATGANLSGGYLEGNALGSWEKLRLDKANLRGFRFRCGTTQDDQCVADWRNVSFRGADLRGADLASFWGTADWRGARFDRTRINLRQLLEIGAGRIAGPLIVTEGNLSARVSPMEYAWLRPHISAEPYYPPPKGAGIRPRLAPGETVLYVEPPIRFDANARRHPLYRRLLPAFVSASGSHLAVTAGRYVILAAEGDAIGVNGHSCGLSAKRLWFDRRSGWFLGSPQLKPGDRPGPLPLLRFSGNAVEVREQGHDSDLRADSFVTCGARAGFGRMERLALSPSEIRRVLAARLDRWGLDGP